MKRSAILCLIMVFVLFSTTIAFASIDNDLTKSLRAQNLDVFRTTRV